MVQYLDDYNQISSKPMKLVLFLFAVEHVRKISRVLQMPRGNALLAGVGGSGRQSVTRLAAHLSDMEVFSIEVSKSYSLVDWREDIKKVLKRAGMEGKATVFLFADTQIKQEAYLEDINGLLNAGEVPNLFENSEKAEIADKVREAARNEGLDGDGTPTTLFAYFVNRCRAMLHMCLAMSPIGDAFRTRLRMFHLWSTAARSIGSGRGPRTRSTRSRPPSWPRWRWRSTTGSPWSRCARASTSRCACSRPSSSRRSAGWCT